MRVRQLLCGLLAALAALGVLALPVEAAVKLSIKDADAKAQIYAKHTCGHDPYCVKDGVSSCRRGSSHRVECEMYIKRATPVQGRYQCKREVRLVLEASAGQVIVANATTNANSWSCSR